MIGRVEQAKQAWYDAYEEVKAFLDNWCLEYKATSVAAASCGLWVRHAMDGRPTQSGPYGLLFAIAYSTAQMSIAGVQLPAEDEAQDLIPMDGKLLPYQLSKLYTDAWKAGQLLAWDRNVINRATRSLSVLRPTSAWEWENLQPDLFSPAAPGLASCVFDVLSVHECIDCDICTEAAARWDESDRITEQWFTGRRLARKE